MEVQGKAEDDIISMEENRTEQRIEENKGNRMERTYCTVTILYCKILHCIVLCVITIIILLFCTRTVHTICYSIPHNTL